MFQYFYPAAISGQDDASLLAALTAAEAIFTLFQFKTRFRVEPTVEMKFFPIVSRFSAFSLFFWVLHMFVAQNIDNVYIYIICMCAYM